ncbi:LPXTG cell wall anchor domain-containing protein [Kitasatospora sp. NPDC097605]|uniref:LPXTG cell wall anchor domain-containing protein n=1 Tax=Kitasatospora sp. NPDC097605 TaxID=3157226 RepID=UPI0033289EBE
MRNPRLTAAAAVLLLTTGASIAGATGSFAADVTPSASATAAAEPTATAEATTTAEPTAEPTSAATTEPAATPSATATATPSATDTPAPTGTPSATATPTSTGPTPIPPYGCLGISQSPMPVTASGPAGGLVVAGGAPQDFTVVFENISSVKLEKLQLNAGLAAPLGPDAPGVQARVGDSDWQTVDYGGRPTGLGSFQVERGAKLTVKLRVTASAKTPLGSYGFTLSGQSEILRPGSAPAYKYDCPQLNGSHTGTIKVTDKAPATTEPTKTGEPSPTGTSTATTAPTASASPSPSAPRPTGGTGTGAGTTGNSGGSTGGRLAETGASSTTVPLAVTGAVAIGLGAAALLVARRRKAARG